MELDIAKPIRQGRSAVEKPDHLGDIANHEILRSRLGFDCDLVN